jgi:hypothetical protein
LDYCLKYNKNPDNILFLKNISTNNQSIDKETNSMDFIKIFFIKMLDSNNKKEVSIKNEIILYNKNDIITLFFDVIYSKDIRYKLFNDGLEITKKYLNILYEK